MEENSDIIICKSKTEVSNHEALNSSKIDYNLNLDLIPNNETLSISDISNYIFEFCQSSTWDKSFKTEFITFFIIFIYKLILNLIFFQNTKKL